MRKNVLSILLFFLALATSISAQDCFKYLPAEGTSLETKSYDEKGKEKSTTEFTIIKKSKENGGERLDVRLKSKSAETDSVFVSEYYYLCKDGKMYVDMTSLLEDRLAPYEGMQVEVDAGKLEYPTNPKAGQQLPGGTVVAKITNSGIPISKIAIKILERKVEKLETVKTPAGTFDCFKIVQKSETKIMFMKVKTSSAEWIAEGIGVVKSESYNKRGKLLASSILSKITK